MIRNTPGAIATRAIATLVLLISLTGCEACCKDSDSTTPDQDVVVGGDTFEFIIGPDHDGTGSCEIADSTGIKEIRVKAGDTVVWVNQTGTDQTLRFGNVRRLFGVLEAIVYADDTLSLKVLATAPPDKEFVHRFISCDTRIAPPGIIVCPPDGPCD